MKPILDKDGALRGFMKKTYSEQLQDEIEPIHREDNRTDLESVDARQYIQAVADSMLPTRHPIYDCKFWIYEEKRLAPYEEYRDFYRRLANGSDNKS